MRPLLLGSQFVRPFSLSVEPDALPVVTVYAGENLLGSATVALTAGTTRRYTATYTLPGSSIALGTLILMKVDWTVDSEDQPTSDLFAGYVAPSEVAHVSDVLTAGLDESALHTALDTYTNKNNWKATGFPTVAAFEARTIPSAEYVTSEQLANLESARLPRLS